MRKSIIPSWISVLAGAAGLIAADVADAQQCKDRGGLAYLGVTANEARSVWLSATGAGSFQLESSQGSQTVDQWQRSRRGLRVTLSPVVSNGNGGVHQLLVIEGNRPCMIDSQNQKGGITFPSFIHLPEFRPPSGLRPPGGQLSPGGVTALTPSLPGGVAPPMAKLPPVGAMPTLPGRPSAPSGVMPSVPGGVAPPIATRPPGGVMPTLPGRPAAPPSGVMPSVPGGVAPPIATLPPSGLTPSLPGRPAPPPVGVMPAVPGRVAPPVATLPPTGAMPSVPGGVTRPVATLPPVGAMPTRPAPPTGVIPSGPGNVVPPSGLMPTLPGGVVAPVATLPPTGVTPALPVSPTVPPVGVVPSGPGGVTSPVAPLPPSGITTPALPEGAVPPIATLPPPGRAPEIPEVPPAAVVPVTPAPAIDDSTLARGAAQELIASDCLEWKSAEDTDVDASTDCNQQAAEQARTGFGQTVPVTPGREFAVPTRWNLWFDGRALDTSDRRHGLDMDGSGNYFTLGADRRHDNDVVVGALVSYESNESEGFDGNLRQETDGYGIGAYLAQPLSQRWAMDTSLVYTWLSNDSRVAVLDGSYDSTRVSLTFNTTGQYQTGEFALRPKITVSYSHYDNDAYDLSGVVLDTPVSLQVARDSFDNGTVEGLLEVSRTFHPGNSVVIPYGEIGANYAFIRPQDGGILTSDLRLASTSAWLGSMRLGARALVSQSMFVEASAGYLSLGQHDNDVWEFRLFVSLAF